MALIEKVCLYYREGASDKVYEIHLTQEEDGFRVTGATTGGAARNSSRNPRRLNLCRTEPRAISSTTSKPPSSTTAKLLTQ